MGGTTRTYMLIGLALALVLSAGCAQIAEKAARGAVEKATGVKVDESKGSVTVTGKDGQKVTVSGGDKKLPANLPSDVPVYPGATIQSSASAEAPEGDTFSFTLETTDPVDKVFDWYKTELKQKSWTIENSSTVEVNGARSGSVSAKKGTLEAMIMIGSDPSTGDKVSINAIVSDKKKQ